MKINIYYGGRGIIDDPTLVALTKIQTILEELRVTVARFNLYEYKNTIPTLPQTLKDADGIILATTVEWYGIGGYMAQFLDACWQFGDKERISNIYMMPVVMSRTYGEREAKMSLASAWEILGGQVGSGICGYIENTLELEMDAVYADLIAKKTENLYRSINQKIPSLPASSQVISQRIAHPFHQTLSPQESEQLSKYVSDDKYVQTQKEDIQELASMFRGKLESEEKGKGEEYPDLIRSAFHAQAGVAGSFCIYIEGNTMPIAIRIAGANMSCDYAVLDKPDVEMQMSRVTMDEIVSGHISFQRAFMSGAMTKMKGEFRVLSALDQVLLFRAN